MKPSPSVRDMSVASMRLELLDILSVLAPDKKWGALASARDIADFTIEHLPEDTFEARARLSHLDEQFGEHSHRALGLAHEISRRRP